MNPFTPYCDVGMLLHAPIRTWKDIDQLRKVTSRGRASYYSLKEAGSAMRVDSHERRVSAAVDVERLMRACSPQERLVVMERTNGTKLREISARLHLSQSRVSQIYRQGLSRMRGMANAG